MSLSKEVKSARLVNRLFRSLSSKIQREIGCTRDNYRWVLYESKHYPRNTTLVLKPSSPDWCNHYAVYVAKTAAAYSVLFGEFDPFDPTSTYKTIAVRREPEPLPPLLKHFVFDHGAGDTSFSLPG